MLNNDSLHNKVIQCYPRARWHFHYRAMKHNIPIIFWFLMPNGHPSPQSNNICEILLYNRKLVVITYDLMHVVQAIHRKGKIIVNQDCYVVMVFRYKDLCAGNRYQGQGKIITTHRYCGMKLFAPALDPCLCHTGPNILFQFELFTICSLFVGTWKCYIT